MQWVYFGGGFLCCWVIFGLLVLLGDEVGGPFDELAMSLPVLPITIVVVPIGILWHFLWDPWRYVVHPASEGKFQQAQATLQGRTKRILKRLYVCWDPGAKFLGHKVFFVRVKRSAEDAGKNAGRT